VDIDAKLPILGGLARFDASAGRFSEQRPMRAHATGTVGTPYDGVYYSFVPGGQCVPLFKVLMTNRCKYNCAYCANRCDRSVERTGFSPEELASTFINMYRAGIVAGLFLSSGISGGADSTMDPMIAAVELVRRKHRFKGYIHLKVLPGASRSAVDRACQLADRVSINIEAPTQNALDRIAPDKMLREDVIERFRWINQERTHHRVVPAGPTTQLVVGAAGETDTEIIRSVTWMYRHVGLSRAYYSAFSPVDNTPLEMQPATSPKRENRLYQADWLLRYYGFEIDELPFDETGNLPLDVDPKLAWANSHRDRFPIELNEAEFEELIRVPGIGKLSASRIVRARRSGKLNSPEDVKKMGVLVRRAWRYVVVGGKRLAVNGKLAPEQLELFAPEM